MLDLSAVLRAALGALAGTVRPADAPEPRGYERGQAQAHYNLSFQGNIRAGALPEGEGLPSGREFPGAAFATHNNDATL